MSKPISLLAPAKVNLFLHICGKRSDGLHLLDSLITFAGIYDSITIKPSPELNVSLKGPFSNKKISTKNNLVLKAAKVLAEFSNIEPKIDIVIAKEIPVASGLGGASVNAAATLKLLTIYWDLNISDKTLFNIGENLGADVPACLTGKTIRIEGVGEILKAAKELPPCWFVFVNPGTQLNTKEVFELGLDKFNSKYKNPKYPGNLNELQKMLFDTQNGLMKSAIQLVPEIELVINKLRDTKNIIDARLSGSGATCFGVFPTENDAKIAAQTISIANPDWWVKAAPLLNKWDEPVIG